MAHAPAPCLTWAPRWDRLQVRPARATLVHVGGGEQEASARISNAPPNRIRALDALGAGTAGSIDVGRHEEQRSISARRANDNLMKPTLYKLYGDSSFHCFSEM